MRGVLPLSSVAAWTLVLGLGQTARADALAALAIYAAAERTQEQAAASPAAKPARLRFTARRRRPAPAEPRSLRFPIPAGARLSSAWGPRRDPFSGRLAWHGGVDLAADSGAPVVATHSGWCTTRYNGRSGLIVRISSPGLTTEYRHLSSILAQEGPIRAGETLGKVGSTGRLSTGPHLHYAVWINGRQVNPLMHLDQDRRL